MDAERGGAHPADAAAREAAVSDSVDSAGEGAGALAEGLEESTGAGGLAEPGVEAGAEPGVEADAEPGGGCVLAPAALAPSARPGCTRSRRTEACTGATQLNALMSANDADAIFVSKMPTASETQASDTAQLDGTLARPGCATGARTYIPLEDVSSSHLLFFPR